MQINKWLFAMVLNLFSIFCVAAVDEIPGYVMEVGVERVQDHLFRYTRFNAESAYPCLRLELIDPHEDWKVVEAKDICEMNGMRLVSDFSYASFGAFQFRNNTLLFEFTFFGNASPGEHVQDCSIGVLGNRIGNLDCNTPDLSD